MSVCDVLCISQIRDLHTVKALERRLKQVRLLHTGAYEYVCVYYELYVYMFVPQERTKHRKLQQQMLATLQELRQSVYTA